MQERKIEGIVLHAINFRENQRIITLFSKQEGILSLIIKGLHSSKPSLFALSSPFTYGEFLYKRGKGEIDTFLDGSMIDEGLELRKSLDYLESAANMTKAIHSSQMPHKASPELFALLRYFLKMIPTFTDQSLLVSSFYLRLLRHEGLLHLSPICNRCKEKSSKIWHGESLCPLHGDDPHGIHFSKEEWDTMIALTFSETFSILRTLEMPPLLREKIALISDELL